MLFLATRRAWANFGAMFFVCGCDRFVDAVRRATGLGNGSWNDSEALLPEVCVLHPYPNERFDGKYPR
jgi:hypothetical protein